MQINLKKLKKELRPSKKDRLIHYFKKRYRVHYKFNLKHLVADLILISAIIVLLATIFFYWWGGKNYLEDNLQLSVTVYQESINVCDEVTFAIDYVNNNDFTLKLVTIAIKLPENFILQNVSRTDYNHSTNTVFVEDLEPGANGRLLISGLVIGDIEKEQELVANLNYYKTSQNNVRLWHQFQKIQEFKYSFVGSNVLTNITVPEKIVNGQEIVLPIVLANNTLFTFDEMYLELQAKNNEVEILEPLSQYLDNAWRFYQVKNQEKFEISPTIKIVDQELKEIRFSTYVKYNGQLLKQSEQLFPIEVFDPRFVIFTKYPKEEVLPGEDVSLALTFENQNGYLVQDLKTQLVLTGDYWDFSKMIASGMKVTNNTVLIDQTFDSELGLFEPEQKKQLTIVLPTKNKPDETGDLSLSLKTTCSYQIAGQEIKFSLEEKQINILENLYLKAFARYYTSDGEQIGLGVLPPKVNEQTNYWVFLQVINNLHDLNNLKIQANLPANVIYTGHSNVPVGDSITYNSYNKLIAWQIPKVLAQEQNVGIAFEVAVTPSEQDLGKIIDLVNNIKVSGVDAVSGKYISQAVENVTTDLIFDEKAMISGGLVDGWE